MKIKNTIISGLILALAACGATPAVAQTITAPVPGPTTTLEGTRADWTAEAIAGGGVILRSSKYGVNATVYRNFRFRLEQWVWDGQKLVPLFSMPQSTTPAAPALSSQDQKDLEFGRNVRKWIAEGK